MKHNTFFLSILGALYAGVFLTCSAALAQTTPEEQAKTILQLFDAGQKDSAYAMLEPLKRSARFVPAVMYTRAQMTPDDRALGLYKEIMALDPGSSWAEKAAYQLVSRYADKRDSVAAHTWAAVLKGGFPKSSMVAAADKLIAEVPSWRASDEDMADASAGKKSTKETSAKTGGKATKPATKDGTKAADLDGSKSLTKDGKPLAKDAAVKTTKIAAKKPDATKPADSPGTETVKSGSSLHGYALQVGIFSSKDLADARSTELRNRKIRAFALPKPAAGKGHYAVVIGPYPTEDEANAKRTTVNGLCGCQSLTVQVK